MRSREVTAFGLIAGLTWSEMRYMLPGHILDLFLLRREYDDAQHGIKREEAGGGW